MARSLFANDSLLVGLSTWKILACLSGSILISIRKPRPTISKVSKIRALLYHASRDDFCNDVSKQELRIV
ncbi:hypothetical protein EV356DRAFT_497751, partial [Viridothelium virens]